jgi:hypothetical protein
MGGVDNCLPGKHILFIKEIEGLDRLVWQIR